MKRITLAITPTLLLIGCCSFLFSCAGKPELQYTFESFVASERAKVVGKREPITASVRSDSKDKGKKHISFDPPLYFDWPLCHSVAGAADAALRSIYGEEAGRVIYLYDPKKTVDVSTGKLSLQWDRYASGDNSSVIGKVHITPTGELGKFMPGENYEGRVDSMVIWIE